MFFQGLSVFNDVQVTRKYTLCWILKISFELMNGLMLIKLPWTAASDNDE